MARGLAGVLLNKWAEVFLQWGLSNEAIPNSVPEILTNHTSERAPAFFAAFWTTTSKSISSLLHRIFFISLAWSWHQKQYFYRIYRKIANKWLLTKVLFLSLCWIFLEIWCPSFGLKDPVTQQRFYSCINNFRFSNNFSFFILKKFLLNKTLIQY